ncbi:MAG: histidine--tRNA ligase [Pseudomonadota bacterium]
MANKSPSSISGFVEWSPGQKVVEAQMIARMRELFGLFGFAELETSAVERLETLCAKGVAQHEIYALQRLAREDESGKGGKRGETPPPSLGLHFDLTVPLARYVAQHKDRLPFPFRRYQMQKVWRGERPQAGRFREFYQCDADIIDLTRLSLVHDADILVLASRVLAGLDVGDFTIRINHRRVLEGLILAHGYASAQVPRVMQSLDRLDKVGTARVAADLADIAKAADGQRLLATVTAPRPLAALDHLDQRSEPVALPDNTPLTTGLAQLRELLDLVVALGGEPSHFQVDLSIARGLAYYTGMVFETSLADFPDLGSVCSGGRYDELGGQFGGVSLPGVGMSLGLSRLLDGVFRQRAAQDFPGAAVLVVALGADQRPAALAALNHLRRSGVAAVYDPDDHKKPADKLRRAVRGGHRLIALIGEQEAQDRTVSLKRLSDGYQIKVPVDALADHAQALLRESSSPSRGS